MSLVQPSDGGAYEATFGNAGGNITTKTAVLTVYVSPQITSDLEDQEANVGGAVILTAEASGTPAPTPQWYRNGMRISGSTTATALSGVVSTSLVLPALQHAQNGGKYSVTFSNANAAHTAGGTATTRTATLTVATPPVHH